jgi:hypothetical protein
MGIIFGEIFKHRLLNGLVGLKETCPETFPIAP